MVLVTKVNQSNSTAVAFIVWKSTTSTWKCEYYCIKDSQIPDNITITKAGNLCTALEFWSDLLASNPGRIVLKTDIKHEDWTSSARVTAHQIQVKRNRNGLANMLQLYDENNDPFFTMGQKYFISRCSHEVVNHLLDGNARGREKFKEQIRELMKPDGVCFESVVIS